MIYFYEIIRISFNLKEKKNEKLTVLLKILTNKTKIDEWKIWIAARETILQTLEEWIGPHVFVHPRVVKLRVFTCPNPQNLCNSSN